MYSDQEVREGIKKQMQIAYSFRNFMYKQEQNSDSQSSVFLLIIS